jgi:hypothetical protein
MSASGAVRLRSGLVLSELAIGYGKSPIVEEYPLKGGLRAGSRAPDGLLQNGDTSTRIYGLIASGKYALLVFVDEPESVQQIADRIVAGFSELVGVAIITSTSSGRSNHRVFDPRGTTIEQYGAGRAYLVRPDGYIGFCSSIADAWELLPRHLARCGRSDCHCSGPSGVCGGRGIVSEDPVRSLTSKAPSRVATRAKGLRFWPNASLARQGRRRPAAQGPSIKSRRGPMGP